ncbi:EXS family-domain-containing protein [Gigaspora rosea]|uniref:EXS family-domain-containing protein n=1 Tax=Gigaspora rosea TaxID=44941 RepID=A0A397V5K8_9GLOM|nr:EXS family-domain-containing protein [Gigaspora rosea]
MKFGKLLQTESVPEWKKKYIDYKSLKVKLEKIQQAQYVELHSPTTSFSNVCESPISEYDNYQHFPSFDENQSNLQNEKSEPIKATHCESPISEHDNYQHFPFFDENQSNLQNEKSEAIKPTHSEPLKPPPIPLKIKTSSFSRTHSILTKVPSRSRTQRTQIISIDMIKNQLHPDEIEFFEALDIELRKINEFYEEKELNAKERFTRINQAYEELKTLKRVKLPNPSRSDWTSKLFKERDNNGSNPSTNESSLAAINYKDAKKKMKKAICEFYRGTEMLKNYRITRLNGSEIYIQKINQSNFVKSKKLDTLMRDTEYIYSKLFGGNSRSHAMKKLKTPNRKHKIPSFMLMAVCFVMYADAFDLLEIPHPYYPLILVLVMLAILFCPLRIFYYSARRWFVYSLGRMIISPFIGIEFRDFILADHFNSLSYSLVALQLLPCFASQSICNLPTSITPLAPILGSFGPIMRFLQCIRRYYDTNTELHLRNAGKYASVTISVYMIFYWKYTVAYYTDDYNRILISKIIYIITQLIATIYTNIWDLKQDWGLFQLDSSNFLLRDELAYKYNRIYYIAMCNNIILRFSWILYFITDNFWVKFFMAFGEILRRWQWDIFRIENEHLTNCESDHKRKQEEGKNVDEVDNIESHRKLPKIIEYVEISID